MDSFRFKWFQISNILLIVYLLIFVVFDLVIYHEIGYNEFSELPNILHFFQTGSRFGATLVDSNFE